MCMFSVIVPVFKVEEYIDKCIQSIQKQSYNDFELILVDDGSPDSCGNICDKYASKDKRIKVVHQENMGLSGARNAGIRIATGEYICFVDSDDFIAEDYLLEFAKEIQNNGSEIVICGFTEIKGDNYIEHIFYEKDIINIRKNMILKIWPPAAWNKCYRKELFAEEMFPVGQTMEDLYLIPSIILKTDKISCVDKALYYYNMNNPSSIMNTMNVLKEYDIFIANIRLVGLSDKVDASTIEKKLLLQNTAKIARKCLYHNFLQNKLSSKQCECLKSFLSSNIDKLQGRFFKVLIEKFLIRQLLKDNRFLCIIIAKLKK